MLYRGEMGDIEQGLLRQAKRRRDKALLAELAKAPKLTRDLAFYFTAFSELDTERSHSLSLARIPRSQIRDYGLECGLVDSELYDFIAIIMTADTAHLKKLSEKSNTDG